MARTKRTVKALPTIWRVSDELWSLIEPLLAKYDPPAPTGRPRIDARVALDGIIYQMRSGCQWEALPKEFGPKSSVHDTLQRWVRRGVFEKIMAALIEQCAELGGVDWQWQSADGAMGKARFGGTKSARTPQIGANPAVSAA